MKETYINIDPNNHTLHQRLTVIWSTIVGKPYHLTINSHNVWKLVDRINQ